jgi:phosphoglucan,water dikinase
MSRPAVEQVVDYTCEPLFWDAGAAEGVMARLAEAGRKMEAAMGGAPQDIEGALIGGELYVVQSRPQVL